ncbi:hypothetical protein L1987_66709 [Smallanthus sonchifolius]|uniref:Uncharacterized protein n=1 Tax=Smallanthus sonchifolius TaxID=185202 RepID=A0ACB9BXV4_9ASTR|nr:hypothetical protein L1987_66709 [Smallanthus sonchifolius]
MWLAVVLGVVPLLVWLFWWWNDVWYGLVTETLCSSEGGTDLPPGYMGLPVVGEMFTFLWYFKFLRRPDDYINSKRSRYGDGIGMYRTHLFGRPSVIVFSPTATKFIFRAEESFKLEWPNVEIVGKTSLAAVHGKSHARLRGFVSRSVNQPEALSRIAATVQPRIVSALDSWAKRRTVTSYKEIKKVTFENIGMFFASIKPGPTLDTINEYLAGLVSGIRSYPMNIPGFAYYHGLQLKKRKNRSSESVNDLMDGLMRLKDEEGGQLSDMEIVDNIVSILVGGYESTTLATTWAVYYLAKYPKDENISLKSSKKEQIVTSDEILKMKYMTKVVDETIRMANIAPFVFRTTIKDVIYKGHKIPKGWKVILWIRYLHTVPENFNDPLCFNPDRWDVGIGEPGCKSEASPKSQTRRWCKNYHCETLNCNTFSD